MRSSIIIPMYRGAGWIPACIAALRLAGPDEIIVVDDGSPDEGSAWLRENAPDVQVIHHAQSRGFAAACNAGLRHATGDVLVLLNQDTEVEAGWLSPLVAALADPTVAAVGSRATYPDGRLQHAGGWINERGEAGHYHEDRAAGSVDYVTGASLALRREVYEQLGGLDERFVPAYFEDVEWCVRARRHGYQIWYDPASRLIHHEESQVAGHGDEQMVAYHTNRLRLVLKQWSSEALANEFFPAEQAWLNSLGQGGELLIAAMHRVYLSFLLRLREVAAERSEESGIVAQVLVDLLATIPTRPTQFIEEPRESDVRDEVTRPDAQEDGHDASSTEGGIGTLPDAPDEASSVEAGDASPPVEMPRPSDARGATLYQRLKAKPLARFVIAHLQMAQIERRVIVGEERSLMLERRSQELEARNQGLEARSHSLEARIQALELRFAQEHDARLRLQAVLIAYLRGANQNLATLASQRTVQPPTDESEQD